MENRVIIYEAEGGLMKLEVKLKEDTVWLSQKQMTELFERDQSVISRHINNIFKEEELERKSNMQNMHIANSDKLSNKRIAAGLFVYFMDKNGLLYRWDGSKRVGDNALVAITIMIAESKAEEKEMMIKLVVNLINENN